jgi:hypothetical protein
MITKFLSLLVVAPFFHVSAVWTPFVNVSPVGDSLNLAGPVLDVNILDNAVSVWTTVPVSGDESVIKASSFSIPTGWTTPVTISDTSLNQFGKPRYVGQGDPTVSLNSSNYAVAAWEGSVFIDALETNIEGIFSSLRTPDGTWFPVQAVSTLDPNDFQLNPENPYIDVSDSGLTVVVWTENRSSGRYIMANFLPFGGGFWGTPIELAHPFNGFREDTPRVKINTKNNAAAVWKAFNDLGDEIGASTFNSITGLWTTVTLDPAEDETGLPTVGIDDVGNAVAVWIRQMGFLEEASESNKILQPDVTFQVVASSFNYATQTWGPVVIIATGVLGVDPIDILSGNVVVDPFGNATAVWSQDKNGITGVYASRLSLGGTWSAPELISDPNVSTNVAPQGLTQTPIDVDRQGNVIVIVLTEDDVLQSIVRYFSLGWQSPEVIAVIVNPLDHEIRLGSCGFAVAQWNNGLSETVQAATNFALFPPPSNLRISQCCDKFATQKRCFNFLSWNPSPSCILYYQIFRNGELIAIVPGNQTNFTDTLCGTQKTIFNYVVIAVSNLGIASPPITASILP